MAEKRPCEICGKKIDVRGMQGHLLWHQKGEKVRPENNPLLNIEKKREGFTQKEREEIIKREGNRCQKCGILCEEFPPEIHHKDRNRFNNSLDNGILFCPNHHKAVHRYEREHRDDILKETTRIYFIHRVVSQEQIQFHPNLIETYP